MITLALLLLAQEVLIQRVDARAARFGELSRKIWEFAEVGYKERRSAGALIAELKDAGFAIQADVADIPTAFTATWGEGKPVIGILGEYLGRIYEQVKARPLYLVGERVNAPRDTDELDDEG